MYSFSTKELVLGPKILHVVRETQVDRCIYCTESNLVVLDSKDGVVWL